MAGHNLLGRRGEELSQTYLVEHGYRILHTNWRYGRLELDIVATNGDELVVVEVKTRTHDLFEHPEAAVDDRKIRHIVTATDHYLKRYQIDMPVRFDILSILMDGNQVVIDHIEDAFMSPIY